MRSDGISVVALVIVLLIMSTLGTILASLIITKQKSAPLPLRSAQAFYLAQAGIEYAIRYAADHYTGFPNNFPLVQESIGAGAGSFNVTYDAADNSITSTGAADTGQRVIKLSRFTDFWGGCVRLESGKTPKKKGGHNKEIEIPLQNYCGCNVYIFQIDMAKGKGDRLEEIKFKNDTVYDVITPISSNHSDPTQLDFTVTFYYLIKKDKKAKNEFKFEDDDAAIDTYTVIYHYYFEGGSEADDYTSKVTFTIS